jgi:uncharacterized protein
MLKYASRYASHSANRGCFPPGHIQQDQATDMSATAALPLQRLPASARWAMLVAISALIGALLQTAEIPAALMLGPLIGAVLVQSAGGAVKIPQIFLMGAQAIMGCFVAHSITPSIVGGLLQLWPSVIVVVTFSLAAAIGIGWSMNRLGIVPGTTPIWGMMPGAATIMVLMAEAYGADVRLVAFMQYLRMVMVAAVASGVALLFAHGGGSRFPHGYFPAINPVNFLDTMVLALAGGLAGRATRIPAGVLLGPLVIGGVLNGLGWISIELPPILLIASYAVIGWNTGLRFTRDVLATAARALPQSIGATTLLMLFCGFISWMLVLILHVDPLSAYLAASPGGVDVAAVIAASTKVDTPFVMVIQSVRAVVLIVIGPQLARWVAKMVK